MSEIRFEPCTFNGKEGDDVCVLRDSIQGKKIIHGRIERIQTKPRNILVTTTLGMYNAREFGQTVFLSEAALQAAQEGTV